MKTVSAIKISSMAGFGPTAWDQDIQRVSMHPPLPEHIEYVEEKMHRRPRHHHIVQRRNPDNDCDVVLIAMEIPFN